LHEILVCAACMSSLFVWNIFWVELERSKGLFRYKGAEFLTDFVLISFHSFKELKRCMLLLGYLHVSTVTFKRSLFRAELNSLSSCLSTLPDVMTLLEMDDVTHGISPATDLRRVFHDMVSRRHGIQTVSPVLNDGFSRADYFELWPAFFKWFYREDVKKV
jgi:hypothetical protein